MKLHLRFGEIYIDFRLLPPRDWRAYLAQPFYRQEVYPPRIVHDVSFGIALLTVFDHRRVKLPRLMPGMVLRRRGEFVHPGDLIWNCDQGAWLPAQEHHLATRVDRWMGVASRLELLP